jgi:hypothetical protein
LEQNSTNRSPQKISTALAAAQAQSAASAGVRFPGEDGGRSLVEMAQRDLDAALQLLADRAQYITGASGAAIALRRDGRNDMLCRASTGTNAPELGALLSTEFGLSGESVRTKRALRCDDAERDARVNREVCRQLGIASVVVMPVVNDDQVLGVFELFSGKANAFGERDLSAVQRLSEMVETAVRLAQATQTLPKKLTEAENSSTAKSEGQFVSDLVVDAPVEKHQEAAETIATAVPAEAVKPVEPTVAKTEAPLALPSVAGAKVVSPPGAEVAPAKKPLFWSADLSSEGETAKPAEADQSHVPPVLRGLKKCEACGFPVSAGRVLCVECEEKKWRGQLRPQSRTAAAPAAAPAKSDGMGPVAAAAASAAKAAPAVPAQSSAASAKSDIGTQVPAESVEKKESAKPIESTPVEANASGSSKPAVEAPKSVEFVLTAGAAPSQSWFSANKYVLIVLLVIAAVGVAVFYLR